MNAKAINLLEYPKIQTMLATHCGFSASKELALALEPVADALLVAHRQTMTTEAVKLLDLRPNLTVGGARDVRPAVDRARRGGIVDPLDLRQIAATIASGRIMRSAISKVDSIVPHLADLANLISDSPTLEDDINRCIAENGEVLDSASPELARLRTDIRQAHERLLNRLRDIVYGGAYKGALQESLITMREGRYVIPVRSEARSQVRGLIHDQSASGQTVYVEPIETIDLTNRWRQVQLEEKHEVERILQQLSDEVAADADDMTSTVGALAEIDLNLAKARFAAALSANEPVLATKDGTANERGLRLVNARHPLLIGRGPIKVVPITAWLGDEFQILVITGPNTGGKTVALKTVGLLTLMAQAGLHIPADGGSRVHVFDDVLADIGDEQSIEQSLSTFSSHMRQVVAIVGSSGKNTLALLDEVGAGTDPAEGSALARAILRKLLDKGAWAIVTTHYTELIAFAHDTPGFSNASVEFDPETLAPTYRLQIGLPGRSNAFAIARRLGLEDDVVESAEKLIDPNQVQVENLLIGIQAQHDQALSDRTRAATQRQQADRLLTELEKRLRQIDEERAEVLERARREAENELADTRAQLRRAAAALQRATLDLDVAKSRPSAAQLPGETPTAPRATAAELAEVARELDRSSRKIAARPAARILSEIPESTTPTGGFSVGDYVRVRSLERDGEIVGMADSGNQADVQVGSFKMRLPTSDLTPLRKKAVASTSSGRFIGASQRPAPSAQFDLRGWRADQVSPELDRYLNDAFVAGMPQVRIIHGKGTGALRQVVHDYLHDSSLVRSFSVADPREGGDGATVVTLQV